MIQGWCMYLAYICTLIFIYGILQPPCLGASSWIFSPTKRFLRSLSRSAKVSALWWYKETNEESFTGWHFFMTSTFSRCCIKNKSHQSFRYQTWEESDSFQSQQKLIVKSKGQTTATNINCSFMRHTICISSIFQKWFQRLQMFTFFFLS